MYFLTQLMGFPATNMAMAASIGGFKRGLGEFMEDANGHES